MVVGKVFKYGMCETWANWMLAECEKRGLTNAANFRAPTRLDCCAWEELGTARIVKTAKELKMTAELRTEVDDYVPKPFNNAVPDGGVEEVRDPELAADIQNAVEQEQEEVVQPKNKQKRKRK